MPMVNRKLSASVRGISERRSSMRFFARSLLLLMIVTPALAATKSYHLELEAYPAAPFPFFSKFGSVDLHVYSSGVRADSFWLKGFSRNGSKTITAMNPVLRMYTDVPIADVQAIVGKLASSEQTGESTPPPVQGPLRGRVGVLKASRYRLVYGPAAWIDLW